MKSYQFESLKGQFLIAMPELADPNFSGSVTCICEHIPDGALGLTINRELPGVTSEDIFREFNLYNADLSPRYPIYLGGPVQENEIFVLHGRPFQWQGSLTVTPELALTNTMDILKALATGQGPEEAAIILGCAGWAAGQLESELMDNAWLTQSITNDIVFHTPSAQKWDRVVASLGFDPSTLASDAGRA